MRIAGLTLGCLLICVAARAQQPVTGAPVQPLPVGGANPDAKLNAHLEGWEKTTAGLTNFRFVLSLKRTSKSDFKSTRSYSGVVLCMKPNYAVVRMDYDGDKSGKDYEAFICDGKAVYEYNGLQQSGRGAAVYTRAVVLIAIGVALWFVNRVFVQKAAESRLATMARPK
jgi:TIGR03009 family protein